MSTSLIATLLLMLFSTASHAQAAPSPAVETTAFLQRHCRDCHAGELKEGGFSLDALGGALIAGSERRWAQVVDRVQAGEMPPPDAAPLDPAERARFVQQTGDWLRTARQALDRELGRVQGRRLTRRELERSLQDLLGIDIPLANQLPEELRPAGFTTVADGQSISHFQLERHLQVVDLALDEALRRALAPEPDRWDRDFDAEGVARDNPKRRCREPEMRNGQAVVWSSGLIYYGRLPATTAPEDGWYRFRVRAAGLKPPESGGVWCTVHAGPCVSSAPLLTYVTAFEALPEPREFEFEAWLPRRQMLEIRPGDATIKKAKFAGGQVGVGEGEPQDVPGVAIERLTMERFHRGPDDDGVRRLLFGDLEFARDGEAPPASGAGRAPTADPRSRDEGSREERSRAERGARSAAERLRPVSQQPHEDVARLMLEFARRAFRRPVTARELAPHTALALAQLDAGGGLVEALRVGYRAILCSPRFQYLTEEPGPLDDHAVAARLSYLLTGAPPDARLRELADAGRLRDPNTIRAETDRLLAGDGAARFVADFAAEWLDLNLIDFTEPDRRLYPDFDAIVQNGMLAETRAFLAEMLRDNRSVAELIDARHTWLNSRLARFYDIDGIAGDDLRRVALPAGSPRGGVLTQGAILKVTANGNNTSPVVRGIWVSERLLGVEIPPPPGGVPAIEPDIRGAKTIREQLEKHKSQAVCAVCHRQIDPPGYALENFDPAGQWRDRYLQVTSGKRERGLKVDPGYALPDGREFDDILEFRKLIVADLRPLAENVAAKLLVYGTGAPISFADRTAVAEIAAAAQPEGYGFRSILHAVVTHPVFLSK